MKNKFLQFLNLFSRFSTPLGPIGFLVVKYLLSTEPYTNSMAVVMATLVWMLIWWVFTQLPIAIPALLPFIIFPFYDVIPASELAATVGSSVIFLFLGGFMISAAVEKWGVHKDFAHLLLRRSSGSVESLIFIFIFIAAFASMWISNTATILILLPVIEAIFPADEGEKKSNREWLGYLMLAAAYASSIGGLATIIGTPPNAIAVGFLRDKGYEALTFAAWMKMALPLAIIGCVVLYFVFVRVLRSSLGDLDLSVPIRKAIFEAFETRGRREFLFEKISIVGILLLCILGWLLVPFLNARGIGVTDSMVALSGGLLLFVWPARSKKASLTLLLEARDLDRLPWATLFLFAGGLALSKGLQMSGWIEWSEQYLSQGSSIAPWIFIMVLVTVAVVLTEVMSNTALAALLIPWALSFQTAFDMPLMSLVLALCFASSLSFMMPVATPPNALAFGRGHVKFSQMLKVGFLLNIIFILIVTAYVLWVLPWLIPESLQ
jgi:solute carrier family 13 (sodium-dependent dicarboxylate transporter), member 2/3/5